MVVESAVCDIEQRTSGVFDESGFKFAFPHSDLHSFGFRYLGASNHRRTGKRKY